MPIQRGRCTRYDQERRSAADHLPRRTLPPEMHGAPEHRLSRLPDPSRGQLVARRPSSVEMIAALPGYRLSVSWGFRFPARIMRAGPASWRHASLASRAASILAVLELGALV